MKPSPETRPQRPREGSTRPGGYEQAITTKDRVTAFLYSLIRDHMPAGMVEEIVAEMEAADDRNNGDPIEYAFSNDFVAAYAVEIAARLRGENPRDALSDGQEAMFRASQLRVRNPQLKRPETDTPN